MIAQLVLTHEEVKLLIRGAKAEHREGLFQRLIHSNTAAGNSILSLSTEQANELFRVANNVLMKEGLDYSDRANDTGLIIEGVITRLRATWPIHN